MINHRLMSTCLAFSLFLGTSGGMAQDNESERQRYANRPDQLQPYSKVTVYKETYTRRVEFRGSGRDKAEPSVSSVKVGFIGPLTSEDKPLVPEGFRPVTDSEVKTLFGRHMLNGALLALEEANEEGGYKGIPFELVRRTDLVQWGQTSNELAKFAYEDNVWAILSTIDSNHSHVLNRATLKAEVPLINAGSTDPTLTEHNIPWLIRCISDDRLNSYELLSYLTHVRKFSRIAVLRVNDRDGRVGVAELIKGARRIGSPIRLELRFQNGDTDFTSQLNHIAELNPEAVVLWANPPEAAAIVRQMKALGMKQEVFGFDRMAHSRFLELAGPSAEGVVVASTFNYELSNPRWERFRSQYRARFNEEADSYAAHAYDGTRLIVEAVREAGLNRVRIRDFLYTLATYDGVTGRIEFDQNMNDISRPWLARVEGGKLEYFRPPDWDRVERYPVTVQSERD